MWPVLDRRPILAPKPGDRCLPGSATINTQQPRAGKDLNCG